MFALNLICEIAGRHAAGRFESFQAQAELIAMDWPNADQIPVTVCHLFSDRRTVFFFGKKCQILEEVHFRKSLLRLELLLPLLCRQTRKVLAHTRKSCHAS
jgi:hypothetical protein